MKNSNISYGNLCIFRAKSYSSGIISSGFYRSFGYAFAVNFQNYDSAFSRIFGKSSFQSPDFVFIQKAEIGAENLSPEGMLVSLLMRIKNQESGLSSSLKINQNIKMTRFLSLKTVKVLEVRIERKADIVENEINNTTINLP